MTLFVIDDDQDDVDFLMEATKELYPSAEVVVARDGDLALELLGQMNGLPTAIFVDRNMPRMNGMDFLMRLKDDSNLGSVPVVMHSTNFSDSDLKLFATYQAYTMQKHANYEQLIQDLKSLFDKIGAENKT
jgi:CheY-like chemotaxis protein